MFLSLNSCQETKDTDSTEFSKSITLTSKKHHEGDYNWQMAPDSLVSDNGELIAQSDYNSKDWLSAIVPGTVLTSLVANGSMPDPYYGLNNKRGKGDIPDIYDKGREYYTYWFRTTFDFPEDKEGERTWLGFEGINYIAQVYLNGKKLGNIKGMFVTKEFDVTDVMKKEKENVLAIRIEPVEHPGTEMSRFNKRTSKMVENANGGNGELGKDVTMLMSAGWDFSFSDGIRDRNTGIWRDIKLYTTGNVKLHDPFVKSDLELPSLEESAQTLRISVTNVGETAQRGSVSANIEDTDITVKKEISLNPGETKDVIFSAETHPELLIKDPKVWWPLNKGEQHLYRATFNFESEDGQKSRPKSTRFGIRSITSDQNTPDSSRVFYVNGKRLFVRGANWIPEGMLKTSDLRYRTELNWTKDAGINMLRLWGGGISESDLFFDLCDELGILVWHEFWMTGNTKPPADKDLYFKNVESTIKRLRNHPSLAYYVSSNEQEAVIEIEPILNALDGTRGYQYESECCGVHDGSPYKYENPMQYYDNTASKRGSRIDGFCPEYGTATLPNVEILREMMDEEDLFPPNKEVWDYMDGNAFHNMTTKNDNAIQQFGESNSIEDYALKGQLVGATAFRSIWENWNYNKLDAGDRFASGVLFWYHNSPVKQVCSRMWDWSLDKNAAFYYSKKALQPLHLQFDFIKNTVTLVNDYPKEFKNYKSKIAIYNLDAKRVYSDSINVDFKPEEVLNDIIAVEMPKNLSQVHFIQLQLEDASGNEVSENFYWRSKDKYEGPWTTTGPLYSGFEALNDLPKVNLKMTMKSQNDDKGLYRVTLENPTTDIAFFNRLKFLDENQKLVRPVSFSDNYFSLLPGEKKTVDVELLNTYNLPDTMTLELEGWNGLANSVEQEIKNNNQ
ncbi:glycoside hydrolase family 2 protein [Flagellimonas maritima]|nr:sugar-binding domain-containing protein [Allomuricauda aurantiaca]